MVDITKRDFIKYTSAIILSPAVPNFIVPSSSKEIEENITNTKTFTSNICKWMVEYMETRGEKTVEGISKYINDQIGRNLNFRYDIVNETATCYMYSNIIECFPESQIEARNKNMQRYIDYISLSEEKKKESFTKAKQVSSKYLERDSIDVVETLKNV